MALSGEGGGAERGGGRADDYPVQGLSAAFSVVAPVRATGFGRGGRAADVFVFDSAAGPLLI